jgi:hypothetical protein
MVKKIRVSEFLPIQIVARVTSNVLPWVRLPMEDEKMIEEINKSQDAINVL